MIIGIGGLSRSGKSYLAHELELLFSSIGNSVSVLDQDDCVLPTAEIPLIRDHVDWEIPESIDWDKYREAVLDAEKQSDVVILDGLMVFWDTWIRDKCQKRIFIKLDKEEFVSRKRKDLRWGKEPEWYIEHIWQCYQRYGILSDDHLIDITLNGAKDFPITTIFQKISR